MSWNMLSFVVPAKHVLDFLRLSAPLNYAQYEQSTESSYAQEVKTKIQTIFEKKLSEG